VRPKHTPKATLIQRRAALIQAMEEIDAELARREGTSDSDLTWAAWVAEAAEGDL
jgi:hypothetical protein